MKKFVAGLVALMAAVAVMVGVTAAPASAASTQACVPVSNLPGQMCGNVTYTRTATGINVSRVAMFATPSLENVIQNQYSRSSYVALRGSGGANLWGPKAEVGFTYLQAFDDYGQVWGPNQNAGCQSSAIFEGYVGYQNGLIFFSFTLPLTC